MPGAILGAGAAEVMKMWAWPQIVRDLVEKEEIRDYN